MTSSEARQMLKSAELFCLQERHKTPLERQPDWDDWNAAAATLNELFLSIPLERQDAHGHTCRQCHAEFSCERPDCNAAWDGMLLCDTCVEVLWIN